MGNDMAILGLVFWLLFAAGVGLFAAAQGRQPLLWALIALLASPLIAFVILLVVGSFSGATSGATAATTLRGATARESLSRLEEKFNEGALSLDEIAQLKALAQREPPAPKPRTADPMQAAPAPATEFTRPCPSCRRLIHPKATTCMHCWAKIAGNAA